jgi:hypothetical protein
LPPRSLISSHLVSAFFDLTEVCRERRNITAAKTKKPAGHEKKKTRKKQDTHAIKNSQTKNSSSMQQTFVYGRGYRIMFQLQSQPFLSRIMLAHSFRVSHVFVPSPYPSLFLFLSSGLPITHHATGIIETLLCGDSGSFATSSTASSQ